MSRTLITKTKNGFDVYVDLVSSHAATHMKDHPYLFELVKEIVSKYEVTADALRFSTDMGRVVGMKDLVETQPSDAVFYAKRPNREKYTRFVHGKSPEPTPFVTIELRKVNEGEYDLFTAFIGELTPSFPTGKDDQNQKNRDFWNSHALVVGNQEIVEGTETEECPW